MEVVEDEKSYAMTGTVPALLALPAAVKDSILGRVHVSTVLYAFRYCLFIIT